MGDDSRSNRGSNNDPSHSKDSDKMDLDESEHQDSNTIYSSLSGLAKVENAQRERAQRIKYFQGGIRNSRPVNPRNKHDKLHEVRERHRRDKISLTRERITDSQSYADHHHEMINQLEQLDNSVDFNQLLDEENEILHDHPQRDESWDEKLQQELADMFDGIDLSDYGQPLALH